MKDKIKKISSTQISLAGEFAVLSQLALYGYDANMTLGHTKGVDILVSDPKSGKMYRLEVKTNIRNSGNQLHQSQLFGSVVSSWIMSKKHEEIIDPKLFYCFVNITKDTQTFRFFIVPSKIVAKYVKRQHEYYLGKRRTNKDSKMRIFRIGVTGEKYDVPTPTQEKYENKWEFKF